MTGDRVIRFATAAVVCAVACFAAVLSLTPTSRAGRGTGRMAGSGCAAERGGLILAASLVLLHEARNGRDVPGLARFMLWLGIGATIGANVAYGAGYGLLGALAVLYVIARLSSACCAIREPRPGRDLELVPDRVACGACCRVHDAVQGRLLSAAGRRLYRQRADRRQDIPGGGSVFSITTSPLAPIPLCRRVL